MVESHLAYSIMSLRPYACHHLQGIPKDEVGTYPGGVLNRFLDTDVIIGDAVAYVGADCTGVPTGWNAIG